MKFIIGVVFSSLLCISNFLQAQKEDKQQVLKVIKAYFDAVNQKDTSAIALLSESNSRQYFVQERNNNIIAGSQSTEEFYRSLGKRKEAFSEEFDQNTALVNMHSRMAVVYLNYKGFFDKKLSHTGVNAITLLNTMQGWKIASQTFTVEWP